MRIQHNIPAMSAYRNYTNNTNALRKNLERLSSGYKINRAGDDAAGLAISEKMRAQITGLQVAQKNAKDGISLVQTAEGALTEVHDMLNRMYSLAEQSANGTYDNEVDRYQLQKEIDSLRSEINRIADSSNFNGINLLDGSMTEGTVGSLKSALKADFLTDFSFDGVDPSQAGAAQVTIDFASTGSDKYQALKVDKTKNVDGVDPSAGAAAEISFTTNTGASGTTTVLGTTVTNGTGMLAGLGAVQISGKKISDLFDLCDSSGTIQATGSNGHTDWTNTTFSAAADTKYILKAKTPGDLGSTFQTALDGVINGDTATEFTPGVNVGGATPAVQAEYDLKFNLKQLEGGQTLTIAGKTFRISNTVGDTAGPNETLIDISGLDKDDTTNSATAPAIDTNNGMKQVATKIQAALASALGTDFDVASLNDADIDLANGTYTVKLTGKNNKTIDGITMTQEGSNKPTDDTVTLTATKDYVPAGVATPGVNGQIVYTGAIDFSKLDVGSKFNIGGTWSDASKSFTGGINIEIVENASDADFDNGKLYFAPNTSVTDKVTQINASIAKQNDGTTIAANIEINANGDITVTGDTDKSASALANAAKAGVFYKNTAVSTATANGQTFTVDDTTYQDILDMSIGSGYGTIGDHFEIGTIDTNGRFTAFDATQLAGTIDGTSFVFQAKTPGKLDSTVMDAVKFQSTTVSNSVKEGWDEGQPDSSKTTSYQLKFDLDKLAGGQAFSIGNKAGNSFTFDITVDPNAVDNGVQSDGANGTEVATRTKIDLSKVDLTNMDDEDNKAAIISAFTDAVVGTNGMSSSDWKATASIDGSGNLTLDIVATKAGELYNLGTIRTSDNPAGAITAASYTVYNASKGGQQGTYAKVSYDFDISKLQDGDVLNFGTGLSIEVSDDKKTGTITEGGVEKNYINIADAKDADKLREKLESLLGKDQVFAGQVKIDTANNRLEFTDYQTGRTAQAFATAINAKLTSTTRDLDATDGGLMLQIGDTADSYNQLRVSINDCHTKAMVDADSNMSISDIDISTQNGAAAAMKVIKSAINYVSDVRGTLGATQNRLDHTINNLSVMQENIQDAESTIRDVDVAEEMMAYTKNNILVQSAQAMLAQANQLPQGVLQLLQ